MHICTQCAWSHLDCDFANTLRKKKITCLLFTMVLWIFITAGLLLINSCFANISREEFVETIIVNGYPKPKNADEIYTYLSNAIKDFSREEIAMLIAQLIHESEGFKYTEDVDCIAHNCAGRYRDDFGIPSESYHGRGYIHMKWSRNYRWASEALGLGDFYLLYHPEVVATDTKLAVLVSTWYWRARVRPVIQDDKNMFGLTTAAIDPDDCKNDKASRTRGEHRWLIYLNVADALKIPNKALEDGCYNIVPISENLI